MTGTSDKTVINFVMVSKLRDLRRAVVATKRAKGHRANRDYKQFTEQYCSVISTYFRLFPTERLLP